MNSSRRTRIFLAILLGILTLLLIGGITVAAVPGGTTYFLTPVGIGLAIAIVGAIIVATIFLIIAIRNSSITVQSASGNELPLLQGSSAMLRVSFDKESLTALTLISVILA